MKIKLDKAFYRKATLTLSFPVFLKLLIKSLFGIVDNNAAPSIARPSISVTGITNQALFIGIATSDLVGRSLGEKKLDKADSFIKELNLMALLAHSQSLELYAGQGQGVNTYHNNGSVLSLFASVRLI